MTLENGSLTIRAHHGEAASASDNLWWVHRELCLGEFWRTVILPSGLQPDRSTATYEDGVLTVRVPKTEAAKPKQIWINAKAE